MNSMRIELLQCSRGHYYASTYPTCPICHNDSVSPIVESEMPVSSPWARETGVPGFQPAPPAFDSAKEAFAEDYGPTQAVPLAGQLSDIDPVVGWLVGIRGPYRGRAFRLHSGSNFLGRSSQMDISLPEDPAVSTERAAAVSYDARTNIFFLERGEGRNQLYLNGNAVRQSEDLHANDRLSLGSCEFLFYPLCGEAFNWNTTP